LVYAWVILLSIKVAASAAYAVVVRTITASFLFEVVVSKSETPPLVSHLTYHHRKT
jgi:hypothetical protein